MFSKTNNNNKKTIQQLQCLDRDAYKKKRSLFWSEILNLKMRRIFIFTSPVNSPAGILSPLEYGQKFCSCNQLWRTHQYRQQQAPNNLKRHGLTFSIKHRWHIRPFQSKHTRHTHKHTAHSHLGHWKYPVTHTSPAVHEDDIRKSIGRDEFTSSAAW